MLATLLRLHRWVALLFALPLIVVLGTGLILSFEPWLVSRAIKPGSVTLERVEALLKQHDPSGQAQVIVHRSYENTLMIGGRRAGTVVDIATGQALPGPSSTANFLVSTRRMHETMLIDAGWLVVASTVALLALVVLGVLMGWPRFSNSLSGWHKGMAWGLLPLIVLSPLTGLFLAMGITFQGPRTPAQEASKPLPLLEAVRIVAKAHDLSAVTWIRPQGARTTARFVEDGEFRAYTVTREGTQATARNWPRLWHEGNFAVGWSALLNVITSLALIGLLATGVTMWAQTELRRRARRQSRVAVM